jgi:hypothetical protein
LVFHVRILQGCGRQLQMRSARKPFLAICKGIARTPQREQSMRQGIAQKREWRGGKFVNPLILSVAKLVNPLFYLQLLKFVNLSILPGAFQVREHVDSCCSDHDNNVVQW